MRRKDREIINKEQIWRIMQRCGVCRVAFHDAEYPYIVPLNFGIGKGEPLTLYFHCAAQGKKLVCTFENHSVINGLGSAVADVLAKNAIAVPLLKVGAQDVFGQVGMIDLLQKEFKLTAEDLVQDIFLKRHMLCQIFYFRPRSACKLAHARFYRRNRLRHYSRVF